MNGNGFKSRKFMLAASAVVAGIVAAFVLPALEPFAWLREHTVAIFGAACALAAAYIGGNALLGSSHAGQKIGASEIDTPAGDPEDGA